MIQLETTGVCCGVKSIHETEHLGKKEIEQIVTKLHLTHTSKYPGYWGNPDREETDETYFSPGIYFFADVVRYGRSKKDTKRQNGVALAEAIKKAGVGKLVETESTYNKNSGNMIKAYLWTISDEDYNKVQDAQKEQKSK